MDRHRFTPSRCATVDLSKVIQRTSNTHGNAFRLDCGAFDGTGLTPNG